MRVVVDLVGERAHGLLAESRFVQRPFLPGGEHNMYEFAFAAASIGLEVELRGWLERAAFERLADGVGAAPRVGLSARLPEPNDLVVVPEGWADPLEYARLLMSPARIAIFVLAPPGLFGWPWVAPGWTRPDPLSVDLDAVAKPAHFQAPHGLGISLLTHSPGIATAAQAAGVPCAFVGTGRPDPPTPQPGIERSVDVAALTSNRWAPLVAEVVPHLRGLTVDLVGESSNEEVIARLTQARVLLWPSRIEGHATIPWEARSVGCVPVALSTNRFAVGLHEDAGAVVVDDVSDLAPAVHALLANEDRWRELSTRAAGTAASEVDWLAYVDRVRSFISSVPPAAPDRAALAGMGGALTDWIEAQFSRAQRLEEISVELERVRADRDRLHVQEEHARAERDQAARKLIELQNRRAVRIALRLAALRNRRTS
ncbi:MAG: hypothetical protein JO206_00240 [Solirubrobacterales bacterium]|nr:hypothetical protein [Solirubrobacterales bacterium]